MSHVRGALQAQLTIFYNQGKGRYQLEQMLAPDGQMLVDFGKLIHDQVPDRDGHTLPIDLTSGAYRVRDLTDHALGSLYEGKAIVDKTYGHAAYGCAACCGYASPFMEFDPLVPNSFIATTARGICASLRPVAISGCGKTQSSSESRPPGLEPVLISGDLRGPFRFAQGRL